MASVVSDTVGALLGGTSENVAVAVCVAVLVAYVEGVARADTVAHAVTHLVGRGESVEAYERTVAVAGDDAELEAVAATKSV